MRRFLFALTLITAAATPLAAPQPVPGTNAETTAAVAIEQQPLVTEAVAGSQLEPARGASVQDLTLFAVIGLGILGLLWVRRHVTEL